MIMPIYTPIHTLWVLPISYLYHIKILSNCQWFITKPIIAFVKPFLCPSNECEIYIVFYITYVEVRHKLLQHLPGSFCSSQPIHRCTH